MPTAASVYVASAKRRHATRFVVIAGYLALWTIVGVLFAAQSVITYSYSGTRAMSGARLLAYALADWYVWALLAPGILWLTRRFDFTRHPWWSAAVHAPASIAFVFVRMRLRLLVGVLIPSVRMSAPGVMSSMALQVFVYWAIVAVAVALEYQRMYREEQVAAVGLKTQLARAELGLLKMQLQPHFLFNTLNAISEQVHTDPDAAERMITHLSELLRHTVGSAQVHEISLGEELALLERYLDIQRARFTGRLEVTLDVDVGAMDALVPNLVLQPLVENAIRHGIAPRASGGRVEVFVRRQAQEGRLLLEVRDDGVGLEQSRLRGGSDANERDRVGIANTVARLRQLYGDDFTFALDAAAGGGTIASISLPFHDTIRREATAPQTPPNGRIANGA